MPLFVSLLSGERHEVEIGPFGIIHGGAIHHSKTYKVSEASPRLGFRISSPMVIGIV